jgi:hypothetical protein
LLNTVYLTVVPNTTYNITIGAGGAGGIGQTIYPSFAHAGGDGYATHFDHVSAPGGFSTVMAYFDGGSGGAPGIAASSSALETRGGFPFTVDNPSIANSTPIYMQGAGGSGRNKVAGNSSAGIAQPGGTGAGSAGAPGADFDGYLGGGGGGSGGPGANTGSLYLVSSGKGGAGGDATAGAGASGSAGNNGLNYGAAGGGGGAAGASGDGSSTPGDGGAGGNGSQGFLQILFIE